MINCTCSGSFSPGTTGTCRRSSPRTRPRDQMSIALVYSLAPKRSSGARYLELKDGTEGSGRVPDSYDLRSHRS
jgi:hypothetical protein